MDQHDIWRHRGSMQYQPNTFYNSTPYSGDNGRSASVGQEQFQNHSYQPRFANVQAQQPNPNSFQYAHPGTWQTEAYPFQRLTQPQAPARHDIDPVALEQLLSRADEPPWSVEGAASRSVPGWQQPPPSSLWPPTTQYARAHTVAEGGRSPSIQYSHPFATRPSAPSDSGIDSGNGGSQDVSLHSRDIFEFTHGLRSAFVPGGPPGPRSAKSDSRVQTSQEANRKGKVKGPLIRCAHCNKLPKTQSDARKHELQHTKPFRCGIHGCQRTQGFATNNDRERHRKSVHGVEPSVGKVTGYLCLACRAANPGTTFKFWPRQDNFKAHIKRKHPEWNEAELLESSEAPRPENFASDPGYESHAPPSVLTEGPGYQQDLLSPTGIDMSRQVSQQDGMDLFGVDSGHFDALAAGIGEGPVADSYGGDRESTSRLPRPASRNIDDGLSILHDAALHLTSPADSAIISSAMQHSNVSSLQYYDFDCGDQQPLFQEVEWGAPHAKRQKTSCSTKSTTTTDFSDNLITSKDGQWKCKECGKLTTRLCDLRKHIKRHTRPYGCTFPNCYENFGSRSDWKRHENTQHILQEVWRCGLPTVSGNTCGILMNQEDDFVNHLQHQHNLDATSLETQFHCKSMRLGREAHHNFWCGFCVKVIAQEGDRQQDVIQQNAWTDRAKHIGDHFDRVDDGNIDDWVCVEHNKKKGLLIGENQKKAKTRLRIEKADDEVDLPEDGIPYCMVKKQQMEDIDLDADGVSNSGW